MHLQQKTRRIQFSHLSFVWLFMNQAPPHPSAVSFHIYWQDLQDPQVMSDPKILHFRHWCLKSHFLDNWKKLILALLLSPHTLVLFSKLISFSESMGSIPYLLTKTTQPTMSSTKFEGMMPYKLVRSSTPSTVDPTNARRQA